jgi:hypothetical protein
MVDVTMTMDEYLALLNSMEPIRTETADEAIAREQRMFPKKKRSTAYQKRYKANFKKVASRFKLKSGKWKKNGFKSAVKLAHKMSKK